MAIILSLIQNRFMRWFVTIVWTLILSIILVQPEHQPVIHTGIPPAPFSIEREIFFTTLHILAFTITCGLWFWAWFGHFDLKTSLILGVMTAIIIGSVTEYLQIYAPDRNPSPFDFATNWLSSLLMAYVIWRKQDLFKQFDRSSTKIKNM